MLFVIEYRFGANAADKRDGARGPHLDYLKDAGRRLKLAGPLSLENDDGEEEPSLETVGSLLVLDADSLTAAQLFTQNDPYCKTGMVETVEIKMFRGVLGDWVL